MPKLAKDRSFILTERRAGGKTRADRQTNSAGRHSMAKMSYGQTYSICYNAPTLDAAEQFLKIENEQRRRRETANDNVVGGVVDVPSTCLKRGLDLIRSRRSLGEMIKIRRLRFCGNGASALEYYTCANHAARRGGILIHGNDVRQLSPEFVLAVSRELPID